MVEGYEIYRREEYFLLKEYFIFKGDVTIDDAGLVTCNGHVKLKRQNHQISQLPVSFKEVFSFDCKRNKLESLQGAPLTVIKDFMCPYNKLKSLQGAPRIVGLSFDCDNNKLESLQGAPESVGGHFGCINNKLTSLLGAPKTVGGNFLCYDNPLTTLEGLPTTIGGGLALSYHESLPLLRCLAAQKGVEFWKDGYRFRRSDAIKAEDIINRYAGQGRRAMFDCQKALEDAGCPENARW
jgi:hypothetical protein